MQTLLVSTSRSMLMQQRKTPETPLGKTHLQALLLLIWLPW